MKLRYYTRSQWGARYRDGFGVRPLPCVSLWAHHSVTNAPNADASLDQDVAHMRLLEGIGQSRFGGGVSYPWVIMPSGRVFEGLSPDRRGAHTAGHNTAGSAICFAGNYEVNSLSDAQIQSAGALIAHGKAKGWWKVDRFTGGHRDVYPTSCPGSKAYACLDDIAAAAAQTGADVGKPAGKSSAHVKAVQALLNDVTDAGLTVDGIPGPATEAATRQYQTDHGALAVDGSPGPATLTALEEDMTAIRDLEAKVDALTKTLVRVDKRTRQQAEDQRQTMIALTRGNQVGDQTKDLLEQVAANEAAEAELEQEG